MNCKIAQELSPEHFKRRFSVQRATIKQLVKILKPFYRATPKPGVKPKLALAECVPVCLEYWREYRTYFHISPLECGVLLQARGYKTKDIKEFKLRNLKGAHQ